MFDFYLRLNFNKNSVPEYSFKSNPFYDQIDFKESIVTSGYVSTTALYRGTFESCFHQVDDLQLWLFGYAFTNKKYEDLTGNEPVRLSAEDVFKLLKTYPDDYLHYLKGNFNIIINNVSRGEIKVITDKLNVLPLYYAFTQGQLAISSNTALLMENTWVNKKIDEVAMCMQSLFDYMLGEYYFVKGIRRCENAMTYTFSGEGLSRNKYWDVSQLYHPKLLKKKESLDLLSEQLKKNVNLYASQSQKILVSLTGGFDGRTNLAILDKNKEDFKCYSYGMPGSKQIRVPLKVAKEIGIQYDPIYLSDDFIKKYTHYTNVASYFSNGTAPIGFCNIPYAFNKLNKYSDSVITGLFGSEVLRPLHNNGIQVNDNSFAIFLGDDIHNSISEIFKNEHINLPENKKVLKQCKKTLQAWFEEEYFTRYKNYDSVTRFFFFIIQEGLRKYFSQEVSIERVFVTTYFPYFDIDLVDLIYRTPWAGMYNGFLGKSKFKRRKGQLLYAHIIKKYYAELGKISFDRGYTSNDLLLPFPINYLKIGIGVFLAKRYMKKAGGNDTFKTKDWSVKTINEILQFRPDDSVIDWRQNKLLEMDPSKLNDADFLTYRHFVSLQNFFFQISNKAKRE